MKRIILIFFTLIFLNCGNTKINTVTYNDVVRNKKIFGTTYVNSVPAAGTNVKIKGTGINVFSDFNGFYDIMVNDRDTLIFSFSSCKPQEISVINKDTINSSLQQDKEFIKNNTIIVKKKK